jgi:S1-C subfamily serine protease
VQPPRLARPAAAQPAQKPVPKAKAVQHEPDWDDEDEPRPRRKTPAKTQVKSAKSQANARRNDDDDDEGETGSKGLKIGLIAGGGVFAVAACALIGWYATRTPARPDVAAASPPSNSSKNDGSSSSSGSSDGGAGQADADKETASSRADAAESSRASSDGGIPEQRLKQMKAATVYVKVDGKQGMATGSGFLIHVNGETGLVATNRHVIAAIPGRFTPTKHTLVFHSGTAKEQVLPAEVVAVSQDQDLAVLKVTSKNLPAPIDLAPTKLRETMTIYTLGFPLGEALSKNGGNPAVTIGKGTVGALPEDENGKLKHVQLDGELNPGNSGGPIIDGEGKLVGIAVSKIPGTKISFAIPPVELTELLKGSAGAVVIRSVRISKDSAELEVEVPVIDPLHNVKTIAVGYVRKDAAKGALEKDKSGAWPKVVETLAPVAIENGKAVTKIVIPGGSDKAAEFYFQSQFALADNKPAYTRPIEQAVNFSHQGVVKLDGAPPWITISSKLIGFTIDMPTKPQIVDSKVRKVGGINLKTVQLGSVNENGIYMAYRMDLPGALQRGAEAKFMDALRDFFVDEWDGVLTGQKNVRAHWSGGWNMGRDFSVNSKLNAKNSLNIRGRFYLVGRTIFMTSVISSPNADLPDDTGRFLGSLAIGEAFARSNGMPEPELTGTDLPGWGAIIDPDKDCKITPRGDKSLTIEIPGKLHEIDYDGGLTNSPRVMQEVEGDFVVTVKISGNFKLGPKCTNPRNPSRFISGGLLLWSDSNNHIRLERCLFNESNRGNTIGAIFEEREGGYCGAMHSEWFELGDCYLRAERKGNKIFGATSIDGKNWKELKPIDVLWPKKIKIGLDAFNSSSSPFAVNFDEFTLKRK